MAFDPVFFAVYKNFVLGDFIHGMPAVRIAGESVAIRSALYAQKASMIDRGSRASFEIDVECALLKGHQLFAGETNEGFIQRRLGLLINLRKAMGFWPVGAASSFGILAGASDPARIYKLVNAESAGAAVTIELTNPFGGPLPITVLSNEKWYIFDPNTNVWEIFNTDPSVGSIVIATALANNYTSSAFCFHSEWAFPNVALNPGAGFDGSEEGAHSTAKHIRLSFVGVDDPVYGVAVG